jgi:hypothetical protein
VTLPEFLVILVVVFMIACPKFFRPKKRRKPLPIRGRLKRKALALRYREPSPEQRAFAERCRQQNLEQSRNSQPKLALLATIRDLGLRFDPEKDCEVITWFDGDRFVISDVILHDQKFCVEQDGIQHRMQHQYDLDKDKLIFEVRGYKTLRRWNAWFLKPGLAQRLSKELGL